VQPNPGKSSYSIYFLLYRSLAASRRRHILPRWLLQLKSRAKAQCESAVTRSRGPDKTGFKATLRETPLKSFSAQRGTQQGRRPPNLHPQPLGIWHSVMILAVIQERTAVDRAESGTRLALFAALHAIQSSPSHLASTQLPRNIAPCSA